MARRRAWALPLLLAATATATSAGEADRDGWEESSEVPAWALSPPAREGHVRVVDAGRSNLLHLAYPFHHGPTLETVSRRAVQAEVARRLRGPLGREADRVAEAVPERATMVRKGFHLAPPEPGQEKAVGGQTYTAYVLWEVPSAPLLATVPEARRADARQALARGEPPAEPAWEAVESRPTWVDAPPRADGNVVLVGGATSDVPAAAKADAWLLPHMDAPGLRRLYELAGEDAARRIAYVLESWRSPRARALLLRPERRRSEAWTLWHVPTDAVLAEVPEARRDAARALLAGP
jgi:hypothetical protein